METKNVGHVINVKRLNYSNEEEEEMKAFEDPFCEGCKKGI